MHNGRSKTARLPWLNTLVAFEAAARLGSLTLAAAELNLTQRWLIPRIDHFRRGHPGVDLRFQTISAAAGDRTDVEIKYIRGLPHKDDGNREIFLVDRTATVCRPELLADGASAITPQDILSLPVLQDTADGWSWRQWCEAAGIAFVPNGDSMIFDTDEASIDACLSGLGVAQANTAFVTSALEAGTIRHLCPSVDATLGAYYAVVHARSNVADAFVAWLKSEGEAGHRR